MRSITQASEKDLEGSRVVRILRENMRSITEASGGFHGGQDPSGKYEEAPEWSGSFGKI